MKNNILITSFIVIFIIMISILILIYSVMFKNVYHMDEKIFDVSNITNIIVEENGKTFDINSSEDIKELLNIIKGSNRSTRNISISDAPNGKEILCIEINYDNDNFKRIYTYKYKNNFYIELPYEGIYKISNKEYNLIKNFIK